MHLTLSTILLSTKPFPCIHGRTISHTGYCVQVASLLSTILLFPSVAKEVGDSCTLSSPEMVEYLPFRERDIVGVADNSQLGNLGGQRLWKS